MSVLEGDASWSGNVRAGTLIFFRLFYFPHSLEFFSYFLFSNLFSPGTFSVLFLLSTNNFLAEKIKNNQK